jgi:hypothetical protein
MIRFIQAQPSLMTVKAHTFIVLTSYHYAY